MRTNINYLIVYSIIIAFLLSTNSIFSKILWPFYLLTILITSSNINANINKHEKEFSDVKIILDYSSRIIICFLFYLITRQLIQNISSNPFKYNLNDSLGLFFNEITLIFLIINLFRIPEIDVSYDSKVATVCIGVTLWGITNIIFSSFGLEAERDFGVSRLGDGSSSRWIAPLVLSHGILVIAQVISTSYLLIYQSKLSKYKKIREARILRGFIIIVVGIGLFTLIKCEARAEIITLTLSLIMLFFTFSRWWLWTLILLLFIFAPITILLHSNIISEFMDFISFIISSKSIGNEHLSDTSSMASRIEIWEYGWEVLRNTSTFLIGDGPVLRDANPVMMENLLGLTSATTAFHNGLLDLLVTNGVPTGLLIMYILAKKSFRVTKCKSTDDLSLLIYLSLSLAASIVDGGIFAYPQIAILGLLPIAMKSSPRQKNRQILLNS